VHQNGAGNSAVFVWHIRGLQRLNLVISVWAAAGQWPTGKRIHGLVGERNRLDWLVASVARSFAFISEPCRTFRLGLGDKEYAR
jgi:hypothetical protein